MWCILVIATNVSKFEATSPILIVLYDTIGKLASDIKHNTAAYLMMQVCHGRTPQRQPCKSSAKTIHTKKPALQRYTSKIGAVTRRYEGKCDWWSVTFKQHFSMLGRTSPWVKKHPPFAICVFEKSTMFSIHLC